MKKIKYKFNPKTLNYEEVNFNFKTFFLKKLLPHFLISLVIGALIAILGIYQLSSPIEKQCQYTNFNLKYKYEQLNKNISKISNAIISLQKKDDNMYRMVFGAEPVPKSIRNAGFGGSDRYQALKGNKNSNLLISTTKKLDIISNQLLVQAGSYDEIIALVKDKDKMMACIPAIQPISNKDLTRFGSPFGYRMHPIRHVVRMHTGIDLTAPTGTPVYASGDGVIVRADANASGYGNHIRISHGYGYITLYGHLSKINVKVGQKVKRGDIIGLVGSTGLSTSPHLHYEVRINNKPVNPVNFYYNDLSDKEYEQMIKESANANTHIYE